MGQAAEMLGSSCKFPSRDRTLCTFSMRAFTRTSGHVASGLPRRATATASLEWTHGFWLMTVEPQSSLYVEQLVV